MVNKPKQIGTRAETAVARYLAANGFPHAERRTLRGREDAGDITGTPGVCWEVKGGEAHVTLRIVSELISATRNGAGEVIDGDPETVAEVKDVWTFARDPRSRDPNWKLVATEEED